MIKILSKKKYKLLLQELKTLEAQVTKERTEKNEIIHQLKVLIQFYMTERS
jgi:hypothetical protein